jgi:hypothetical protein
MDIEDDPFLNYLDIKFLEKKVIRLIRELVVARESIAHWGNYASDYAQRKYGLAKELDRLDILIESLVKQVPQLQEQA